MMPYDALAAADPDIAAAVHGEASRQNRGLTFIASENHASAAVRAALGSTLTDKYAEGYPGKRYYGGNAYSDAVERSAIARACAVFGAQHANVQPHSGSGANIAAYLALAPLGGKILAMDLAHGGHLTHGASVSLSGKAWTFVHYGVSRASERLDMDEVHSIAVREKPAVIVSGFTAYPGTVDFAAFGEIAREVGAAHMVDMAHIAGLVAGGAHPSPVPHADVVTTTTHKTLRGPRGAMILCREEYAKKIDSAVFPGTQGGPLMHAVAAKAVALHEAMRPEFTTYAAQVVKNARALADALAAGGLRIVGGGTDNHLVLADVSPLGIGGAAAEGVLEAVGLYANKNLVPFDTRKAMDPSGLRFGTAALTTRGLGEHEMRVLGALIVSVLRAPDNASVREDAAVMVRQMAERWPAYSA